MRQALSRFSGPIIGAILMVLASVLLSELTSAWLLYLGFVFLIMVMYAPGGVASLIMVNVRMAHFGKLRRLWGLYGGLLVTGVVMMLGVAALIEMIYHRQLNAGAGPVVQYLGVPLDTGAVTPWLGAAALAVVGWALMEGVRRRFARAWSTAQEEIESEIQARGALQ